eukprot:CAMPEP_0183295274 /NCGR_PEP_ID=MMETSP0160_2-20130417/3296_1 /TAXON_ID=2839 ORGANISM="Odontella Sinensis, Strain Grunow 1884" /NCGR_SAMPLE_ID=MMETSP0160_2 /ASSEMBLY_ACC=CAM_ASM_000250 /LENGTH=38 /DNA_ID= /DNA_START= /DNA_END= /DNA_ORIENTATION=
MEGKAVDEGVRNKDLGWLFLVRARLIQVACDLVEKGAR